MTIPKKKSCQHIWSLLWHDGVDACFRCGKCRETKTILADRKFKVVARRCAADQRKRCTAIHKTWHAFEKKFKISETEQWRFHGWDFIENVERWAKGRKDVQIVRVDDNYFASSILILIEHAVPDEYMGLSVVVVPQCAPDPPITFFLYPWHAAALFCALRPARYRKEQRFDPITKLDREFDRAARQLLKKHLAQEKPCH